MLAYIVRRVLFSLLVLFFLSVAVFYIVALAGDPLAELRQNPQIRGADLERFAAIYGLDQPLYVQYGIWMRDMLLYGDFGLSFRRNTEVGPIIAARIWPTVMLIGSSLILGLAIGIPLGIYSAIKQYTKVDKAVTFLSFVGFSTPVFLLGLILQLVFAIYLADLLGYRIFPVSGMDSGSTLELLRSLALPVTALAVTSVAVYSRFQRSAMLDVLAADYLRTARAKGLSRKVVYLKHALRNALIPIVTIVALELVTLLAGAIVVETVFSWPGMGFLLIQALNQGDYNVARAIIMIVGVLTVLFNLLADILYSVVDPRVSYS